MADTGFIETAELSPIADAKPIDEAKKDKKRKLAKKALLITLGGVVAKVGVGVGVWWMWEGSHYVSTDNAYVGAATAQINSQTSGQILEVRVADTDQVKRGDVLATIDPSDAQLTVNKADADYRRALQRVEQYFAQEAQAEANVKAREADLSRALQDYRRRANLASSGAISEEELTTVRSAYEAAQANLRAAQQSLAAQQALTRGVSIDHHPETDAARAALDNANLTLGRTVIRAPIDGVVTQKRAEIGQRIDPGQPMMAIAPLSDAYVDANFKEGQLAHVQIGQPVKLTSDLYGEHVVFHGVVKGLGGGTGSAFAVIPAQNATGNWIKVVQRVPVRISLDPAELAAHPLRVGLSMKAEIDTRKPKA